MRTYYDTIYLAPHLDDAALSCGGQIHQLTAVGKPVLIVTIMAGDPPEDVVYSDFARELHERWDLAVAAEAARREEDAAACQILGADFVHWSIPDCVYRMHPKTGLPLYPTWEDVVTAVHPAEFQLIQTLATRMAHLPPTDRIVAPLGVGNHADHLVTRQAAELCFGAKLCYFEDYPYVQEEGAITAVIPANTSTWQCHTIPLNATDISAKIKAIIAYKSQLSTFFTDYQDLTRQIETYAQQTGGECLWQHTQSALPEVEK
ncbi:MAG: PIG-L family deacetylase [Anaerolineae bacterium]|nr:PIG-L family deacetylase [Anaerolineae bacterium]